MSNKQIYYINASALKQSACNLRLFREVCEGWSGGLNPNDMEFGSAVHEFIKVMRFNKGNPMALALALTAAENRFKVPMFVKYNKKYLTMTYLKTICISTWQNLLENDEFETLYEPVETECYNCKGHKQVGDLMTCSAIPCPVCSGKGVMRKPLAEVQFCLPYYEDDHYIINLAGTIDDICKHRQGCISIRDYKTTSAGKADEYLEGYALNPQLKFYGLVIKLYAAKYPDSIWAAIYKQGIFAFIDGIFLRGAEKHEFKRSEVFKVSERDLIMTETLVKREILGMVKMLEDRRMGGAEFIRDGIISGACETNFGHCKYFHVCTMPDDQSMRMLLEKNFVHKPYNPLTFNEV